MKDKQEKEAKAPNQKDEDTLKAIETNVLRAQALEGEAAHAETAVKRAAECRRLAQELRKAAKELAVLLPLERDDEEGEP